MEHKYYTWLPKFVNLPLMVHYLKFLLDGPWPLVLGQRQKNNVLVLVDPCQAARKANMEQKWYAWLSKRWWFCFQTSQNNLLLCRWIPFWGGLEMAIWLSGPAAGAGGGNASHGSFHCSLAGQGCRLSGWQSWRGAGGSIYSLFLPPHLPSILSPCICAPPVPPPFSTVCSAVWLLLYMITRLWWDSNITPCRGQNTATHFTINVLL